MTRLTEEQITQKAREGYATDSGWSDRGRADALAGRYDHAETMKCVRAAIIATLTEYAPHLLPRDPDEEKQEALAQKLADEWDGMPGQWGAKSFALYVIKHLDKERGK